MSAIVRATVHVTVHAIVRATVHVTAHATVHVTARVFREERGNVARGFFPGLGG